MEALLLRDLHVGHRKARESLFVEGSASILEVRPVSDKNLFLVGFLVLGQGRGIPSVRMCPELCPSRHDLLQDDFGQLANALQE